MNGYFILLFKSKQNQTLQNMCILFSIIILFEFYKQINRTCSSVSRHMNIIECSLEKNKFVTVNTQYIHSSYSYTTMHTYAGIFLCGRKLAIYVAK